MTENPDDIVCRFCGNDLGDDPSDPGCSCSGETWGRCAITRAELDAEEAVVYPAPFPLGSRVKYIGTREYSLEGEAPHFGPGMVFTIIAVRDARPGTGALIDHDEETDEPFYDTGSNGQSTYELVAPNGKTHRRCISADMAAEWELV